MAKPPCALELQAHRIDCITLDRDDATGFWSLHGAMLNATEGNGIFGALIESAVKGRTE
jgi:hypothetical protein